MPPGGDGKGYGRGPDKLAVGKEEPGGRKAEGLLTGTDEAGMANYDYIKSNQPDIFESRIQIVSISVLVVGRSLGGST